jgi:hypothetical protein
VLVITCLLHFNFYFYTTRQLELHQRIYGLR